MPNNAPTYFEVLTAAVNDMATFGFDSLERVTYWQARLREAMEASLPSPIEQERQLREALAAVYVRMVDRGQIARFHPGVGRFTLERLRPHLRAELDRRIMAAANLIRLNRAAAIDQTLRRFSGWSTSLPKGQIKTVAKREEKAALRKSLSSLPFETRRVLIDQGHKLTSSINAVVARDGGALAAVWHSHWRQAGYDYRPDHRERDGQVYLVRGCWANREGLVVPGAAGYSDEVTQPAEEPFCRCYFQYLYNLRQMPTDMLTKKGHAELERARALIHAA